MTISPATEPVTVRQASGWWLGWDGTPGPVMRMCLAAAVAAPSIHNTQPWLFVPRRRGVEVHADLSRQVRVADPAGRELLLSMGAAVFNLRVALRAHGRVPVQMIDPAAGAPGPMVRVSPGPATRVSQTARSLAWAIPRRRTNRWPFTDLVPPWQVLADLARAASAEGALLRVLGRDARRNLLELTRTATGELAEDPSYEAELAMWTDDQPERRDGITRVAAGPRPAGRGLPMRDLGLAQPAWHRQRAGFEAAPTIVVIYGGDRPEQWLRAGQALQRTLLTATIYGLAATPLTQALEIPRLRELLSDPRTGAPAQVVLRVGYRRYPAPPSPRRPLADFLLG